MKQPEDLSRLKQPGKAIYSAWSDSESGGERPVKHGSKELCGTNEVLHNVASNSPRQERLVDTDVPPAGDLGQLSEARERKNVAEDQDVADNDAETKDLKQKEFPAEHAGEPVRDELAMEKKRMDILNRLQSDESRDKHDEKPEAQGSRDHPAVQSQGNAEPLLASDRCAEQHEATSHAEVTRDDKVEESGLKKDGDSAESSKRLHQLERGRSRSAQTQKVSREAKEKSCSPERAKRRGTKDADKDRSSSRKGRNKDVEGEVEKVQERARDHEKDRRDKKACSRSTKRAKHRSASARRDGDRREKRGRSRSADRRRERRSRSTRRERDRDRKDRRGRSRSKDQQRERSRSRRGAKGRSRSGRRDRDRKASGRSRSKDRRKEKSRSVHRSRDRKRGKSRSRDKRRERSQSAREEITKKDRMKRSPSKRSHSRRKDRDERSRSKERSKSSEDKKSKEHEVSHRSKDDESRDQKEECVALKPEIISGEGTGAEDKVLSADAVEPPCPTYLIGTDTAAAPAAEPPAVDGMGPVVVSPIGATGMLGTGQAAGAIPGPLQPAAEGSLASAVHVFAQAQAALAAQAGPWAQTQPPDGKEEPVKAAGDEGLPIEPAYDPFEQGSGGSPSPDRGEAEDPKDTGAEPDPEDRSARLARHGKVKFCAEQDEVSE